MVCRIHSLVHRISNGDAKVKMGTLKELADHLQSLEQKEINQINRGTRCQLLLAVREILFRSRSVYTRSAALYCLRFLVSDLFVVQLLWKLNIDWAIAKGIDKAKNNEQEREHSFSLVEVIFDEFLKSRSSRTVEKGILFKDDNNDRDCEVLTNSIVLRLVMIADTVDDNFRGRAVQIILDLSPHCPRQVCKCGGVVPLVSAVMDSKFEDLHGALIWAIIYFLDSDVTRKYISFAYDIQPILHPFVEMIGHDLKDTRDIQERLKLSRNVLHAFMLSWGGLYWFADDPRLLKSLLSVLTFPGPTIRKQMLLELFYSVLSTITPPQLAPSKQTKDSRPDAESDASVLPLQGINVGIGIRDVFLTSLISVFAHSGMAQTLVHLLCNSPPDESALTQSASHLIQLLLKLSDIFLPHQVSIQLHHIIDQTITDLLETKTIQDSRTHITGNVHEAATAALLVRQKETYLRLGKVKHVRSIVGHLFSSASSISKNCDGEQNAESQGGKEFKFPLWMNTAVDDTQFKQLLQETNVNFTKDYLRWNCDRILLLLRGPLRSQARLLEALKTKFFKRILSFLKPKKKIFPMLPYREEFFVYSTIGARTIQLLLVSSEGTQKLQDSGLLSEIQYCLELELNANASIGKGNIATTERVFSKEQITHSMSRDYFAFLMQCSETPNGIQLLERLKILETLERLTQQDIQRDELCHQILKNLNFGWVDTGGPNCIIQKILINSMRNGSKPIRYFATRQLKSCIFTSMSDSMMRGIVDDVVRLLLYQIDDTWNEVATGALTLLYQAIGSRKIFYDCFVGQHYLYHDKICSLDASVLLHRVIETRQGFQYLKDCGWVDQALQLWGSQELTMYATKLENESIRTLLAGLARSVSNTNNSSPRAAVSGRSFAFPTGTSLNAFVELCGGIPPHWLGPLCSTQEGFNSFVASPLHDMLRNVLFQALPPVPLSPLNTRRKPGIDFYYIVIGVTFVIVYVLMNL